MQKFPLSVTIGPAFILAIRRTASVEPVACMRARYSRNMEVHTMSMQVLQELGIRERGHLDGHSLFPLNHDVRQKKIHLMDMDNLHSSPKAPCSYGSLQPQ